MPQMEVTSPDGRLTVELAVRGAGSPGRPGLWWRAGRDRKPIILDSRLGLEFAGRPPLWAGVVVVSSRARAIDQTWRPPYGQAASIRDHCNELEIELVERVPPHRPFRVMLRAYDRGAAVRYVLPDDPAYAGAVVDAELTQFAFPAGARGYQQRWPEDEYRLLPIAELDPRTERPLVVELPPDASGAAYACVMEAAGDDWSRMLLAPETSCDGAALRVQHDGGACVDPLPRATPWRAIGVADRAIDLITLEELVLNLSPACEITDTSWIRPGKAIREATLSTAGGRACVDFAVRRGLQYVLYDAGWYGHEHDDTADSTGVDPDPDRTGKIPGWSGLDLQDVIAYARERGIGVWLYVNRRALERQIDVLAPLYSRWGVAGIKFGFVNVGPQGWTRWLHDAVRTCAKHRLMVDVHDYYRPVGFGRAYPNLLTQEGTRGNEHFPTPRHNATLPFTRFCAGAADYTICYRQRRLRTTDAHQLAMAAVYYSPLQLVYWYNRPADYDEAALPELAWFDRVPTTWDQTVPLAGEIGRSVAVARRRGDEWFLGALAGDDAVTLDLPLTFLDAGVRYTATLYEDLPEPSETGSRVGLTSRDATAASRLHLALKPSGGAAVHFVPAAR